MATWSEIKELSNLLKKTQDGKSITRLPERTWVSIVHYLTKQGRLKLHHTIDGRLYLTRDELDKEIREELEGRSGRITIEEISSLLGVDESLIASRSADLINNDAKCEMPNRIIGISGELITHSYIIRVAQDIQDILEERGFTTLGDLARSFNLSTTFISNIIEKHLKLVSKDNEMYYTHAYLTQYKAIVRGYCRALVRPMTLTAAASQMLIPERLFSSLLDSLITANQVSGSLIAGKGTFVPACYTKSQDSYIAGFYKQNGYVEWSFIKRLGITDPGSYIRNRFPEAAHTSGVSISDILISQIKAATDEAITDSSWTDLYIYLPISLNYAELNKLLAPSLKHLPVNLLPNAPYIATHTFTNKCHSLLDNVIRETSETVAHRLKEKQLTNTATMTSIGNKVAAAKNSKLISKATKTMGGHGVGAREIKTKNTKKKYMASRKEIGTDGDGDEFDYGHDDSENLNVSHSVNPEVYLKNDDLVTTLTNALDSDVPEELIVGVVELLRETIDRAFADNMNKVYSQLCEITTKRADRTAIQDELNGTLLSIQLFERGIYSIDDEGLRKKLLLQLVKDQAVVLINRLCILIAKDENIIWPNSASSDTSSIKQQEKSILYSGKSSLRRGKKGKKGGRKNDDWSNECPETELDTAGEELAIVNTTNLDIGDHGMDKRQLDAISDPVVINYEQRERLTYALDASTSPSLNKAAREIISLNEMLRNFVVPDHPGRGPSTPLSDIYAGCDCLAGNGLGLNLTFVQRQTDSHKRKVERIKARELFGQTLLQLDEAVELASSGVPTDITLAAPTVAQTAACLFSQTITDWPVSVPGKLVPDLVNWLVAKLAHAPTNQPDSKKVIHFVAKTTSIIDLLRLTQLVGEQAKSGDAHTTITEEMGEIITRLADHASVFKESLNG